MRSISLVAAGATNIPGQAINDTTRVLLLPARMEVGFLAAIQEMVGVNYLPAILLLAVESNVAGVTTDRREDPGRHGQRAELADEHGAPTEAANTYRRPRVQSTRYTSYLITETL